MKLHKHNPSIINICDNYYDWPNAWMVRQCDIVRGEEIIKFFAPFIEEMIAQSLSKKTIKSHIDNLWLLGGEIMRGLNMIDNDENIDIGEYINGSVDDEGGPYIAGIECETDEDSFDTTCRKLHKYIRSHLTSRCS